MVFGNTLGMENRVLEKIMHIQINSYSGNT